MQSGTLARSGETVDYTIDGQPGDILALAFAVDAEAFFFPVLNASLVVGYQFIGIPVGALPASGTLTISTTVPIYPPGIDVERYYVQSLGLRNNGTLVGGSSRAITLLAGHH